MIKLVIFDWNGTLLSDVGAIVEGVSKELAVFGHSPISVSEYRRQYDVPISHFYMNMGLSQDVIQAKGAEAARVFHAFYEPRVARAHTRPGTRATLKLLARRGVACIILSNHTMEGIYFQLERLKLDHYFSTVLANNTIEGSLYSGKEDRLSHYLEINNIASSEAAIVGDTVEEIRIGRNLGLQVVSITGGHNSTERLEAGRPNAIVKTIPDILKVLGV